ncbi:MAG: PEP-CTERM sorting domain-containing protein [Desulfuromonadaceae bacterium]|nr:PEP-CTERM sorting domain-containing protein [Desulfuromonadaceae bacterium]MDD5107154.1 PEP-CTERM sorting domain-containing protein [Desulfuromonadaceae bacterium]
MKKQIVALLAGALLMLATSAMATPFSGSIWTNGAMSQDAAGDLLLPDNMPTTDAIAYFQVDKIDFDSNRGTTTYNTFLQGSNSLNQNGLVWADGTNDTIKNSFFTGPGFVGSIFQFTGTAYFDANTTIRHDDGFYLTLTNALGSTPYDRSYPTAAINDSLGNAAGVYDFVLNYGACNNFPEVLITSGVAPVPEPGTIALLGLGMAGLAVYGKRRKNNKA